MDTKLLENETIISLKEYLPKLDKGIRTCIELLRENNEIEGIRYLELIVEGLNWSIESITLTMNSGLHAIKIDNIEFIKDMIASMENKDYGLLADLLEYEAMPLIQEWQANLKSN